MNRNKYLWCAALSFGLCALTAGCAGVAAPVRTAAQEENQQKAEELARIFKPDIMLVSQCAGYYAKIGKWPRVHEAFSTRDPQVKEAFAALAGDSITFRRNEAGNLEISISPAKGKASTDKTINEMFPITGNRVLEVYSKPGRNGAFRARYLGEDPPLSGAFTVKPSPLPSAE